MEAQKDTSPPLSILVMCCRMRVTPDPVMVKTFPQAKWQ
jgi:hypothetical protein